MAKTICKILGVVFLLVGVVGFVMPGFLGTHLSVVHNLVHIISGAVALYLGFAGTLSAARLFCIVSGSSICCSPSAAFCSEAIKRQPSRV